MSDASQLLSDGTRLLGEAAAPSGVECELNLRRRQNRSVGWAEGKPSVRTASVSQAVCVRVLEGGRQGLLTTTDLDGGALRSSVEKARSIARLSPPDATRRFGVPAQSYPGSSNNDAHLFSTPADALLDRLKALEAKVLAKDRRLKKVIKFNIGEERAQTAIVNSLGLSLVEESTDASFVAEILAEDNGQSEIAWDYSVRRRFSDVPIDEIAGGVAEAAARALGGAALPTAAYAVVLHPRVGTQLLSLLAEAVSAEAVQLGRSFFAKCMGKKVASDALSVIDDGLLPDGVASAPFDDEGTPHERTIVIENGRLRNYLYDLRTGAKEGVRSNGHGIKEALFAAPSPHPTNFYIAPGAASPEELLGADTRVFHIHDVMGLHMADPISGEFSLGAAGHLFEGGAYARPVRGVTIAGDIKSLLAAVSGVGRDLTWHGGFGCPSLLIPGVTVAGS